MAGELTLNGVVELVEGLGTLEEVDGLSDQGHFGGEGAGHTGEFFW